MKKIFSTLLAAVMLLSVCSAVSFAEETAVPTLTVESTIYAEGFIDGYSTLKIIEGYQLEYDEEGAAVLTLSFEDGTEVDDSLIDSSNAVVTLVEGDGYYVNMLALNDTALDSETWTDGQNTYTMDVDSLVWDNQGYEIQTNGGLEWSGIGGDGSGRYTFTLEVSGILYDGEPVEAAEFKINYYIYGREFSGGTNGAAGYDDLVLPEAAEAALEEVPEVSDTPVFTWVGDGEKPIVCDYETDNFYITWPEGVDASALTAADITLSMASAYGDVLELTADEDYSVYYSDGTTQISVNYVYWAFTPVYTTLTITVSPDNVDGIDEEVSETYDIASVYTHMIQTGGGEDGDLTVITYTFYGVANLTDYSQVYADATYVYAYDDPDWENEDATSLSLASGRISADYFLIDNGDGTYSVTDNYDEATVYDGNSEDGYNTTLIGNTVFITKKSTEITVELDGEEVSFVIAFSGGGTTLPADELEAEDGYIMTTSSNWDNHQRWAWLYINDLGWLESDAEETAEE